MRREQPRDLSASVRARLLQIAKERHEEFQLVLTRYAADRFLYRLSRSVHRETYLLKGATLFAYWTGEFHRVTRDLDLLGAGDPQISSIVATLAEVCEEPVEDDGLEFLSETVTGTTIKAEDEYEGVRVTLTAMLGKARIPLQIDIGFGDAVTPAPQEAELPAMLNLPSAHVLAYPRETVIAEKCEALVHLGLGNSRLKDFYDLWYLAAHFDFEGAVLARALAATFNRRQTSLPSQTPAALTPLYYEDAARQAQWRAFLRKSSLPSDSVESLEDTIKVLLVFLMPLFDAIGSHASFDRLWRHEEMVWSPVGKEAGGRSPLRG